VILGAENPHQNPGQKHEKQKRFQEANRWMAAAADFNAFIFDLLDVSETSKGSISGFRKGDIQETEFVCEQVEMKAQLLIYFAPGLIRIKTVN
jgi:hypothetical protein